MTIIIFGFKIKILFLNKRKIVRILILGAGKMGRWLSDSLCLDEETAVFDTDKTKLKYLFNVRRLTEGDEIRQFDPELVINAAGLSQTENAFRFAIPFLSEKCILSDIASVKNNLEEFYRSSGFRFASSHPMFGPTFANIGDLRSQTAILIKESCPEGHRFFRNFYQKLNVRVFEAGFSEHDRLTAYSLSTPFAATLAFVSCLKPIPAPGTTFKKHMEIADGLLSEDDELLTEILFNKYSADQIGEIGKTLDRLLEWIIKHDSVALKKYLNDLRTEWENYKNVLCRFGK